jgi:predicted nucleotide-binding protein
MNKQKAYPDVLFDSKTISEANRSFRQLVSDHKTQVQQTKFHVEMDDADWTFDTFEEYIVAADQGSGFFRLASYNPDFTLTLYRYVDARFCTVAVTASTRDEIESIFSIFDANAGRCHLPEEEESSKGKVFIGHGHDPQWRDLKDHLHEKHHFDVTAYEIGSREGHTVRDILEEMLDESAIALLVMTGEDKTDSGALRARQNVVHEAGLFQGRLGFTRAIVLREEGTEEFSNLAGIHEIRFPKGGIRETFGDVVAFLNRERERALERKSSDYDED